MDLYIPAKKHLTNNVLAIIIKIPLVYLLSFMDAAFTAAFFAPF